MDRYRSPQFSLASLQIGSPRSLRPREDRHAEQTLQRYDPQPPQPPVIPVELSQGHPVSQPDGYPHADGAQHDPDTANQEPSDVESSVGYASPARRLLDGFVGGLRRIPHAMAKHHSRESLYQEYLNESEGASRPTSRYRYASTVLSDIPESEGSEAYSSRQSYYPQPRPFRIDPVNNAGTMPIGVVGSPTYTNSGLTSGSSKRESIEVPLPPKDTWAYYARCIQIVLYHVYNLPWSSERIVDDYVPSQDGRSEYGEQKPRIPWYTPRGGAARDPEKTASPPPVVPEFFIVPTISMPTAELAPPRFPGGGMRTYSDGAATAVRPMPTPMTATSAGYGFPSPGVSSHGQGRHLASYSWYSSSPPPSQPLAFPWFSEASTPYAHTGSMGLSP